MKKSELEQLLFELQNDSSDEHPDLGELKDTLKNAKKDREDMFKQSNLNGIELERLKNHLVTLE